MELYDRSAWVDEAQKDVGGVRESRLTCHLFSIQSDCSATPLEQSGVKSLAKSHNDQRHGVGCKQCGSWVIRT